MSDVTLTRPQALMLAALAYACREGDDPYARKATPRGLARLRWPDSRGWLHRTRKYGTNDPGAVGGTMPMKAATVLWRLHGLGLAWKPGAPYDVHANLWWPTAKGLRWLDEHPTPEPEER